jgi:hypothetical protein
MMELKKQYGGRSSILVVFAVTADLNRCSAD